MIQDFINDILRKIDNESENIDIYGCNVIEDSIKMVEYIQSLMSELRNYIVKNPFQSKQDEILFFKELKPEVQSKLFYYSRIYRIESKCPNGSNTVIKKYLNDELDSLKFYFDRHLDFYQYYRSKSTHFDNYYFVRGKTNIRLCTDSSIFEKDHSFSTGYDYKIAKILSNEMLRIYLNKRLIGIERMDELCNKRIFYTKTSIQFTGKKAALVEIGYALACSGDLNYGNASIKEIMDSLSSLFNIDLGDYYHTYITMKDRKKDRTLYLNFLIQALTKRMDEDDAK